MTKAEALVSVGLGILFGRKKNNDEKHGNIIKETQSAVVRLLIKRQLTAA